MRKQHIAISAVATAVVMAAAIAGCGGGGGTSVLPGHGGGGNPSPTPNASPTPVLMGNMNVALHGSYPSQTSAPLANAFTEFSCGCTTVAGTGTTDGSGNFTLATVSTPEPNPSPMYTMVPGRNYIVVSTNGGNAGGPNNATEAWTIMYAGNQTSHNHYLGAGNSNSSDVFTAAVALYVYWNSVFGVNNSNPAFDHWNFNDLAALYTHFSSQSAPPAGPNAQEIQLFTDIVAQQEAPAALYPSKPGWNHNQIINNTIRTDLTHVMSSGDTALPSPCPTPGGTLTCANPTPTP